ncbi:hypothetical protein Aperf_G00000089832 [Anoplocephala perfoliata]
MNCQDSREKNAQKSPPTTVVTRPFPKAAVDQQIGPSRRGSLSIIQPKVSLNDMFRIARNIKFDNGSNAADIPLPLIAMKFNVLPISALSSHVSDKSCCLNREDKMSANEPMEYVDIKAELDLGVVLQRWLTKLIDSEVPEIATPRRGSSFVKRKSDGFGKRQLSKMSAKQATAESLYRFAHDRGNSDLQRPWTNSITPTSLIDTSVCPSASTGTLSKLVRQSSSGSADLFIQSIDLLSSNSSVSESLTEKGISDRR